MDTCSRPLYDAPARRSRPALPSEVHPQPEITLPKTPLPFIDLAAQRLALGDRVDAAIMRVVNSGSYILGPEVAQLERDLAAFCGAKFALGCSNGTDALALFLMARKVSPGEAILCPSFTFAATAEVVAWFGAMAVFVDVDERSFNMDPASLDAGIRTAKGLGLTPAGVICVDLFGQPADYDAIVPICEANKLWLLCDAAQSFGASYRRRKVGTFGSATATSFYPAKPLGCYGDGGAVFTDDEELLSTMRSLRVHGQGSDPYDNVRIGMNGRLDTVQAAILIEKLRIFPAEIEKRDEVARRYSAALNDVAVVPHVIDDATSVWAQYTIRVPAERRAGFAAALKGQGVPTAVYYPKPLHQQTAYRHFPTAGNGLPVSDRIAREVISLPMHPYLEPPVQDLIVAACRAALTS
jgi:dTDP-4-amino-4,6-dideoxygalactose transaminase